MTSAFTTLLQADIRTTLVPTLRCVCKGVVRQGGPNTYELNGNLINVVRRL